MPMSATNDKTIYLASKELPLASQQQNMLTNPAARKNVQGNVEQQENKKISFPFMAFEQPQRGDLNI